jgi:hypothetical protein
MPPFRQQTSGRALRTHVFGKAGTDRSVIGKAGSHGARVQNCSLFSCPASVSHPSFPIVSVNGQRQSGGHWNVALGLLGTSIGLPGFSAGGW